MRTTMPYYLIGAVLFLTGWPVLQAQVPQFKPQSLERELQGVGPRLAFEAPDGFIWLGTDQGLGRFDGQRTEWYVMPSSETDNKVTAIGACRGQIWAGYADGRVYRESQGVFSLWDIEEGLPAVPVTGIADGPDGQVWIATYGEGLYVHNGQHLYNIDEADGLPGNDIYTLHVDTSGTAWVGTDGGLSACRFEQGQKRLQHFGRKEGVPDEIVRVILPGEGDVLWLGTHSGGIARFDLGSRSCEPLLAHWPFAPINSLALFGGLELWIATEGDGLLRYHLQNGQLEAEAAGRALADSRVSNLLKDREGNLWACSLTDGLLKANRQFEFIEGPFQSIQAVMETGQGQVWVGCQEGLYTRTPQGQHFNKILDGNFLSLYDGADGKVYAGTFGSGLYILDDGGAAVAHLTAEDGLSNESILDITGQGGEIWLATLGGVNRLVPAKGQQPLQLLPQFGHHSALGTNFVYTVFSDRKGRLWLGTDGEGLSMWDGASLYNFQGTDSVSFQAVYSITEDERGHIWFSTARNGIFEYDGERFHHLAMRQGIRDLAVSSLATDALGNILIIHASGIDRLDPVSKHLIYYDEEADVKGLDPNLNAVGQGQGRTTWLGVQQKLIRYTAIGGDFSIHPSTVIKRVSVFLSPSDIRPRKRLRHDENNLAFEFVGLWYTSPEKVRYRYKLEGLDPGWIESRDQQAFYSNLPPGKYRFCVSSTENGTFNGEPEAAFAFAIAPPFWQRWWFIVLAGALISGGLWYAVSLRETRQKRLAALHQEKVESQYEALKSQINPHFLFNSFNTLAGVIEESPQDAVVFVGRLADFYRNILQYREQPLIGLDEELRVLEDYAFLLHQRYGQGLELKIVGQTEGHLRIVPLALQLLVENAVKHNVIAKSRPLQIEIKIEGRQIQVSNNKQPKLAAEPSTRFGLQSLVRRYQLHAAPPVRIIDEPGLFAVVIPLLK